MKPITVTGMQGFLLWLQQDQPGIYAKLLPMLPKIAPEIFVAKNSLGKLQSIYKTGMRHRASQKLGALGCYICDIAPLSCSFEPSYDCSVALSDVCVGTICPGPAPTVDYSCPTPATTPSPSTASTGYTAPTTAAAVGSAISGIASAVLTASQAATLASIIQSQLARAQSGESPASVSSKTLGVPTVSTLSGSMDDLILLALVGVGAWVALS
jgi:hypothetical protein